MGQSDVPRYCLIKIAKQALNFSIGHFTIFNRTERENLHGHNFQVSCDLTGPVDNAGLMFDYGIIKRVIRQLCEELDEKVILPSQSPYLDIVMEAPYTVAVFNGERLPFLPRDVLVLPIANTTIEEFSNYFLDRMLNHPDFEGREIKKLVVKVSSSPGQTGCSTWEAP